MFRSAPQDGRAWPTDTALPAGYMDGADQFDPLFFSISPAEAMQMDPQERLFLQTAYHAMEHAGYAPQALSRQGRVAVLAGVTLLVEVDMARRINGRGRGQCRTGCCAHVGLAQDGIR